MRQCKELPFVVKQKRGPHIGNRNLEGTVINKKKTCGIEVIGAIHLNVQRFWMGGEEWVVIKCIQRLELLRLRAARSSWKTSRAPGKREASRSLGCNALASTVPDISRWRHWKARSTLFVENFKSTRKARSESILVLQCPCIHCPRHPGKWRHWKARSGVSTNEIL